MKKNTKLRCFDKELDKKLEYINKISESSISIKNCACLISEEIWNNVSSKKISELKESNLDLLILYLTDVMQQAQDYVNQLDIDMIRDGVNYE